MVTDAVRSSSHPLGRAARHVGGVLSSIYEVLIGEPIRGGRLRLSGTTPVVRFAAVTGVVGVVLMLGSLSVADVWRGGDLVFLQEFSGQMTFLPLTLLPVTLLAMFLAWVLFMWGAAHASFPVKLGAAILFLILNSDLGHPLTTKLGAEFELGPEMARAGYFAAPAILTLYAFAAFSSKWGRRLRIPALFGVALAVGAVFGGQLVAHVDQVNTGISELTVGPLFEATVSQQERALIPLFFAASIAIAEFSFDVARAAVTPAGQVRALAARLLLLGLVAVKLWIQFFNHAGERIDYITSRPVRIVGPILAVLFFAAVYLIYRRRQHVPETSETDKERVIFSSAMVLAAPRLFLFLLFALAAFFLLQFEWFDAQEVFTGWLSVDWLFSWGEALIWLGVLVVTILWFRRSRKRGPGSESALGLLLVAVWIVPFFWLKLVNYEPALDLELVDLLLTICLLVYAVLKWSSLTTARSLGLAGIVVFSWLLMTEGDFLAIIGSVFGLSDIVILVFGVLFLLLADSSFASEDSRHFPRPARLLLWVGYLLLSMTLANWHQVTHGSDVADRVAEQGFFYLAVPIGAWLLITRGFRLPGRAPTRP